MQQMEEQQRLAKTETVFANVIRNWAEMPDKAKQHYIAKAEEHKGRIANADVILSLARSFSTEVQFKRRPEADLSSSFFVRKGNVLSAAPLRAR